MTQAPDPLALTSRRLLTLVCGALSLLPGVSEASPAVLVTKDGATTGSAGTRTVALHDGQRTVLSFQSSVGGEVGDFALVIPIPETVDRADVSSPPGDALAALDGLTAPRLEELWEQDPCTPLFQPPSPAPESEPPPAIEPRARSLPSVAPYEGARVVERRDAASVSTWLKGRGYAVAASAESALERAAREPTRLLILEGRASSLARTRGGDALLPPVQIVVDGEVPSLPSRFVAGEGPNEAVIWLVGPERLALAGASLRARTDVAVTEAARGELGGLWATLLDQTLAQDQDGLVLSFAGPAGSCAACGGPPLTAEQWDALGADRLPSLMKTRTAPRVRPVKEAGLHEASVRHVEAALAPCFEAALAERPKLTGSVTVTTSTSTKEWTVKLDVEGAERLGPTFAACAREIEAKGLRVTSPHTPMKKVPFSLAVEEVRAPLALAISRFHLRDGAGTARELPVRSADGADLQTRYVIRHPWTGPVPCSSPKRGVWGAAPRGVKGRPVSALTGLPFERAAPVPLAPLLATEPASPAPSPSGPPPASSSDPREVAPPGGCGCTVSSRRGGWPIALVAVLALLRRLSRARGDSSASGQ